MSRIRLLLGVALLVMSLLLARGLEAPAPVLSDRRGAASPSAMPAEPDPGAPAAVASTREPRPGRRIHFLRASPLPGPADQATRDLLAEHATRLGLTAMRGELRLVREFSSLSGHHLGFEQVVDGVPVHGSRVGAHLTADGRPLLLLADVFPVVGAPTRPRLDARAARAVARNLLLDEDGDTEDLRSKPPRLVVLPEGRGGRLAWLVDLWRPEESARVFVDARTGEPVAIEDLRRGARGTARLFDPNPVYTLRNGTLENDGDRDRPRLDKARRVVTLERLDGTGFLRGTWADATPTKEATRSESLDWTSIGRSHGAFEALMAYFHIDRVQAHLQSLGLDVNAESQRVDAHATVSDNSWFDLYFDRISLGDGGVDDGEDADVILHEYGHAIQADQTPGLGLSAEGAALAEGFSDFLAVAFHEGGDPVFDPLVGSWDTAPGKGGAIPFLRRVNKNVRYPRDFSGRSHKDGEIWSRFLWDMMGIVGRDDALQVAIEAHFLLSPHSGFADAANAVLLTNLSIRDGHNDVALRLALTERGLPFGVAAAPPPPEDEFEENDSSAEAAPLAPGEYRRLLLADEDWFRIEVPPYRQILVLTNFDGTFADIDLEARAPGGALLAESRTLSGTESLTVDGGLEGALFLLRVHHALGEAGPATYELLVVETDPEELVPGVTRLLRLTPGTIRVFRIPVDMAAKSLRLRARKAGRRGARPQLRVTDPAGAVRVGFGEAVRGGRVKANLSTDLEGAWHVEVRAGDGTSGRVRLKARLR